MDEQLDFETLAVRAGIHRTPFGEHSEPMYLTSSFVFENAAQAAARFANQEPGNIYSRFTNPTVTALQERLAAMEGAEACVATASGMSAILACCMGLMKAGEHIVSSRGIFGATVQLFDDDSPQVRRRDDLRLRHRRRSMAARRAAEHEALLSRDAVEPAHRDLRHRCAEGGRACGGRLAGRGQLLLYARAAAAARIRRGPRHPHRDQVPRRAGAGARRRGAGSAIAHHGRRLRFSAHGGTDALGLQRVGDQQGARDAQDPHGGAIRFGAGARALARDAAGRSSASTIPACRRIRSTRLRDGSRRAAGRSSRST